MRNRILFLAQCLPFPPHSGVLNRTFHTLEELQREFDVALVAFSRRNHQPDGTVRSSAVAALREVASDVQAPVLIESEWSSRVKIANQLKSVVSGEPYVFYEYDNADFGTAVRAAMKKYPPDLIHLDSIDLYGWVSHLPAVPTACTHHNIESELLRLPAKHVRFPGLARYIRYQATLLEKVERRMSPRFAINVMTSQRDEEHLKSLAPDARTTVVPNGVDVDFFSMSSTDEIVPGRLAFLGPTYMFPNRDAVQFFLSDIFPRIRERCPGATFHTVGKNPPEDKAEFESHAGTVCHGYLEDIRPVFGQAECSVVPIRVGGGTRLKILDAWSMGKAIVSTAIGCEGLATVDGENILIRDDPNAFADAVVEVLRDKNLRDRLGREARRTVERHYAWRKVGAHLNATYKELIQA